MNLLNDLDQATRIMIRCKGRTEFEKAKMNFIINMTTVLEVFSRHTLLNRFDDRLLEDSFTLNMILHTVTDEHDKKILIKMIQLRNQIVHEGKAENLADEDINVFHTTVKSLITKSNGKTHGKNTQVSR